MGQGINTLFRSGFPKALIHTLLFLALSAGCRECQELTALKASLKVTGEGLSVKQDESLTILKENTTALAAIKSLGDKQIELNTEIVSLLKQKEASLVDSKSVRKEDDQQSAEPQEATRANQSQPKIPVASAPAVRSSSVVMKWDIEGNKNPSILETARHLREDHGIIADGMSHQQMHDAHAAAHEGRKPVAMKSQAVQFVNRGTSCPGGVCPTRQSVRMRWRR
jgi:TolA-binding protein